MLKERTKKFDVCPQFLLAHEDLLLCRQATKHLIHQEFLILNVIPPLPIRATLFVKIQPKTFAQPLPDKKPNDVIVQAMRRYRNFNFAMILHPETLRQVYTVRLST